jgi:hypothetical protein
MSMTMNSFHVKQGIDMSYDYEYKTMYDNKNKVGLSVEQRIRGTKLLCLLGVIVLIMGLFEGVI